MRRQKFFLLCIVLMCLLVGGCSKNEELPFEPVKPKITLQNKNIEYNLGDYCWKRTETESNCSDPAQSILYKNVKEKAVVANSGGVIRIKFPIKPDKFVLYAINTDGDWEVVQPDHYRYNPPSKPGYYRYTLSAVWEEKNTASYYFGIQIDD